MSACNDLKCSELLCVPTQSLPPGYSTIFFEAAMSGGRARNTASAAELCRLMRLHVGHLDEEKYRASNYEDVVTEYEELMLDILALTERPNRSALEAAAKLAFTGVQASEKAMFAQQLHKAFKECRTKAKSVTSGAKTAASVLRVVKRLRDLGRSSATPLPVASGTAASSSADTTMDNAGILQQDVFAVMGVSPPKKVRRLAPRPSEALTVASSAPDLKEGATVAQFFEWEKRVAVRMHPGGRREEAKMSAGSNGFLVATWRDGAQEETECPTLLEDLATRKKPASAPKKRPAQKRPAAAPAAAALASEGEANSEESLSPLPDLYNEKTGKTMLGTERQKLRPNGCGTCRNRRGCTPSCWRKRGLL